MLVTGAMKLKTEFSMGLKKKRKNRTCSKRKRKTRFGVERKYGKRRVKKKSKNEKIQLSTIIKAARNSMKRGSKTSTVIKSALRGARSALLKNCGKQKVMFPRILRIPYNIEGA